MHSETAFASQFSCLLRRCLWAGSMLVPGARADIRRRGHSFGPSCLGWIEAGSGHEGFQGPFGAGADGDFVQRASTLNLHNTRFGAAICRCA